MCTPYDRGTYVRYDARTCGYSVLCRIRYTVCIMYIHKQAHKLFGPSVLIQRYACSPSTIGNQGCFEVFSLPEVSIVIFKGLLLAARNDEPPINQYWTSLASPHLLWIFLEKVSVIIEEGETCRRPLARKTTNYVQATSSRCVDWRHVRAEKTHSLEMKLRPHFYFHEE